MPIIRVFVIKMLGFSTFRILHLKRHLTEYISIRIFSKHKIVTVFQTDSRTSSEIAILALYADPAKFKSLLRLIDLLRSYNISVVCVLNLNENSSELISLLKEKGVSILVRNNIGRDFGAYQAGLQYITDSLQFKDFNFLYLLNDSIIYPPNFGTLFKSWNESKEDFSSIYTNFEYKLHAQSFALKFSRKSVEMPAFKNFWKSYLPLSDRRRSIQKGELKLTEVLIKSGLRLNTVINQSYLDAAFLRENLTPPEKITLTLNTKMNPGFKEKIRVINSTGEIFTHQASRMLTEKNPTHFLGTFLTRSIGAPLKCDLIRSGNVSLLEVNHALKSSGIDESELQELAALFTAQGSKSSYFGLRRVWFLLGLI